MWDAWHVAESLPLLRRQGAGGGGAGGGCAGCCGSAELGCGCWVLDSVEAVGLDTVLATPHSLQPAHTFARLHFYSPVLCLAGVGRLASGELRLGLKRKPVPGSGIGCRWAGTIGRGTPARRAPAAGNAAERMLARLAA